MVILGGLALAAILAGPLPAAAGNVFRPSSGACRPSSTPPCPRRPGLPPALVGPDPIYQRGSLGQDRPRDRHQHGQRPGTTVVVVTQPIYVSPGRCWYPGHWTYEWVPQWTAYNAWVDQQVSPDGDWIGGYYERRWYPSGSYQPYWVEGYYDGC